MNNGAVRRPSIGEELVKLTGIRRAYPKTDGGEMVVLDDVSLTVHQGEVVGLLGRSGSGKSTLLRIIAGLSAASSGNLLWRGKPPEGPCEGMAMVFQSFALFPWLTVIENVELGLEALGVAESVRRKRANDAIDLIGLAGFESAYPKELSGGMRQRVGLARALVVHPSLLLMDEPFSALDVLTAETLRTDLIDLWIEGRLPIKSVLMVTHNIEEAVLMCDRVLLLSSNPGKVVWELSLTLPHPRNRLDPTFRRIVDEIYSRMTQGAPKGGQSGFPGVGIGMQLPETNPNILAGLLEALASPAFPADRADLPDLAAKLQMEVDDLFPIAETAQLLRFADLADGDIKLTDSGRLFGNSEIDARKRLFGEHLMAYVPLVGTIRHVLDERPTHGAPRSRFADQLEDFMTEAAAERTLRTAITWGRYGELFTFNDQTQRFSLEDGG